MGIKGINKFLKTNLGIEDAFFTTYLNNFSGQRIAIDACGYFYQILSSSNKEVVLQMVDPLEEIDKDLVIYKSIERLVIFLSQLSSINIIPVFVWDGKKIKSKKKCQEKRIGIKDNILEKINNARSELEGINILLRTKQQIKEFRNLLTQYNNVNKEDMLFFKNLLGSLGFPSIQAINEGEKLCSNLATEGLVGAVWSVDTDNYALGTPLLITSISEIDKDGDIIVNIVDLRIILRRLGKSHNWLIDFCIMCGCDFNENIPNIGPKKSYDLLMEHSFIDYIEDFNALVPKKDRKFEKEKFSKEECLDFLNYEECRDIFKFMPSGFNENEESLNFDFSSFETFLSENEDNLYNFLKKGADNLKNLNPKKLKLPLKKKKLNVS